MITKRKLIIILVFCLSIQLSAQTQNEQLWDAATKNDVKILKELIDKGIDINAKTRYGSTALTFAAFRGNLEAVNMLLDKGADPNLKDAFYGATPFTMSLSKGNMEILKAMINHGLINCYDARTGKKKYGETLKEGKAFSSSPIAADGKLYFTSEEKGVFVVKAGPEFEIISSNPVGEICMATPAISDGMIFIRAQHHVFCFSSKK